MIGFMNKALGYVSNGFVCLSKAVVYLAKGYII